MVSNARNITTLDLEESAIRILQSQLQVGIEYFFAYLARSSLVMGHNDLVELLQVRRCHVDIATKGFQGAQQGVGVLRHQLP